MKKALSLASQPGPPIEAQDKEARSQRSIEWWRPFVSVPDKARLRGKASIRVHVRNAELGTLLPIFRRGEGPDGCDFVLVGAETRYRKPGFILELTRAQRSREALVSESTRLRSKLQRSEARLREIEAKFDRVSRLVTIGELSASIAHEIGQPLAAIVTSGDACVNWLTRHEPNVSRARISAERVVVNARRAGEVIKALRRLVSGAPGATDTFDILGVIESAMSLLAGELGRSNVSIALEHASHRAFVRGDRVQLQRVVVNLILNSIEAMQDGSVGERVISVLAVEAHGEITVTVRDSGVGIEPATLEHIFDSFYTTKRDGLGLGLALSRLIIQSHGGRLWATSRPGLGSCFHFSLPRAPGGFDE